jgi:hypothetical protein
MADWFPSQEEMDTFREELQSAIDHKDIKVFELTQQAMRSQAKLQRIERLVTDYDPHRIGTYVLVSELQAFRRKVKEVLDS